MAPVESEEPLGGLMRNASPAGNLLAQQALGKLQSRLARDPAPPSTTHPR